MVGYSEVTHFFHCVLLTITAGVALGRPTPFSFTIIAVIFQLHPPKFHMLIVANQT